MNEIQKARIIRIVKICVLVLIGIIMFKKCMFLFTSQIEAKGRSFPSDLDDHIEMSIKGNGYSILFRTIEWLYKVTDTVNISHMLTDINANIPINYKISSECNESVRSVNVIDKATKATVESKTNSDLSYTFAVNGGNFQMYYNATVPYYNGVILYCIICGVIILIVVLTLALLIRYNGRLKAIDELSSEKDNTDDIDTDTDEDNDSYNKNDNNKYDDILDDVDDYMKKYYGY